MKCFGCPLKFSCALWFWGAWDVNLDMCNCIDVRLVCLDNVAKVDQILLNEWKEENPKPIKHYDKYTKKIYYE